MKQIRLKGVVNIFEGRSDHSVVWNPGSSDMKYRNEVFVSDASLTIYNTSNHIVANVKGTKYRMSRGRGKTQ
jgi:hypothetical protein